MLSRKHIAVTVEKGLILEVKRDDENEIYLNIRKAKEGEEQKEIEGHYGYQYGETLIYHFE